MPWLLSTYQSMPGCQGGKQEQLPAWTGQGGGSQGDPQLCGQPDSLYAPDVAHQVLPASPGDTAAQAAHCSSGSLTHHVLVSSPLAVSCCLLKDNYPEQLPNPASPIMCAKLAAQSSLGSAEMVFPPL